MANDKYKCPDLCAIVREQLIKFIIEANKRGIKKLPSEKKLSEVLQVSRVTIRTVLATLEYEGKITRLHGSGTYINPHTLELNTTLFPQVYFGDLIRLSGYSPTIEILDASIEDAGDIGASLNIASNRKIIKVSKIYRADNETCICCIDYLNCAHFRNPAAMLKILRTQPISIFQFFYQYTDLKIIWGILRLKTADDALMENFSDYIDVPQQFLVLDALNYDSHDKPLLSSKSFVNTHLIDLYLVRGRYPEESF